MRAMVGNDKVIIHSWIKTIKIGLDQWPMQSDSAWTSGLKR